MRKWVKAAILPAAFVSLAAVAQSMDLPEPVSVPAGHKMTMKAVGIGELTYECRAKATDAAAYEWVFVGPVAKLIDAVEQGNRQVLCGPDVGVHRRQQSDRQAGRGRAGDARQHPAAAREGRARDGQGRHDRRDLHPAREHQGRCRACDAWRPLAGTKKQVPYQADYLFFKM